MKGGMHQVGCGPLFLALRELEVFCLVSGICNSFHKRTLCTMTLAPPALSQGSGLEDHCKDVGQPGWGLVGWVRAHEPGQADITVGSLLYVERAGTGKFLPFLLLPGVAASTVRQPSCGLRGRDVLLSASLRPLWVATCAICRSCHCN